MKQRISTLENYINENLNTMQRRDIDGFTKPEREWIWKTLGMQNGSDVYQVHSMEGVNKAVAKRGQENPDFTKVTKNLGKKLEGPINFGGPTSHRNWFVYQGENSPVISMESENNQGNQVTYFYFMDADAINESKIIEYSVINLNEKFDIKKLEWKNFDYELGEFLSDYLDTMKLKDIADALRYAADNLDE